MRKTISKRILSFLEKVKCEFPRVCKKMRSFYYAKVFFITFKNRRIIKTLRVKENLCSSNPLVSVVIPTYNNAEILVGKTIPSVLKQTYQHFEIVIVGDACTDNTEERIDSINDKRICFVNLKERGDYPEDPYNRWLVAGIKPMNMCLELCSGEWIAPLNDDDEFTPDHIEILLNKALKEKHEFVYGKVKQELALEEWKEVGSWPLRHGCISHISVLYSSMFKFFKYDMNSWKYGEPGDWNLWKRMKQAGVRMGFVNKIVGIHYAEKQRMGM